MGKIPFGERQSAVKKVAKHGETLLFFQNRGPSKFLDPEYGEFTCNYYHFIQGKSIHQKRRTWNHIKKITLEEASKRLGNKFGDLIFIKEWGGASTKISTFIDKEYGKFKAKFSNVIKESHKHPIRVSKIKSEANRKIWTKEKKEEHSKLMSKVMSDPNIKSKRKNTMMERYGAPTPLENKNILKKQQQTMLRKYGVKQYAQRKEWLQEFNNPMSDPDRKDEIIAKIIKTKIKNGHTKIYENKTMSEWAKKLGKAYTTFQSQVKKYGFERAIQITKSQSGLEVILKSILDKNDIGYKQQFEIKDMICDFKVNSDDLIIECDGMFWHSDLVLKNKNHCYNRRKRLEGLGYTPLFFNEYEILNKVPIIESVILNKLGRNDKIYARKTIFESFQKYEAIKFFNKNHLMGKGSGFSYCLKHNDEVVAAMQIKRNGGGFEISRFCSKLNTQVVGGFSKLLKRIIKIYKPKFISTFIDRRYGQGNYLPKLGFKQKTSAPSFYWISKKEHCHRLKFKGNSGYNHGFYKLWDAGQENWYLSLEEDNYEHLFR